MLKLKFSILAKKKEYNIILTINLGPLRRLHVFTDLINYVRVFYIQVCFVSKQTINTNQVTYYYKSMKTKRRNDWG